MMREGEAKSKRIYICQFTSILYVEITGEHLIRDPEAHIKKDGDNLRPMRVLVLVF